MKRKAKAFATCPGCSEQFEVTKDRKKVCSLKCNGLANRLPWTSSLCLWCSAPISSRRVYEHCSQACLGKARAAKSRGHEEPAPVVGARWVHLRHGRFAMVDEDDYERVSAHTWGHRGTRIMYPCSNFNGTFVSLHRFICAAPPGMVVDHVNGDTFDNRKANLRVATLSQNALNRMARRGRSCEFKGVRHVPKTISRFSATASREGKRTRIGCYGSAEEAARAYDDFARAHHGAFARLNFPRPGEMPALRPNDDSR